MVRDLSFFVPEGQVLGFLGPNGAGKTTVMRMLTAFLPPTTGRVVVAGVDLDQDPVALRRNVGYLPENVPLYPELRVDEYLRFRADIEEVPRAEVRDRMDDVVEQCLIGDVSRQVIGTLSNGYRQRVGLADALVGGLNKDNRYTFKMVQDYVDETVLVSEEEIAAGMLYCLQQPIQPCLPLMPKE